MVTFTSDVDGAIDYSNLVKGFLLAFLNFSTEVVSVSLSIVVSTVDR